METTDRRKILVADDNSINRAIICNAFKDEYIVLEAENGLQALEILKSNNISAVLLDLQMPLLDGFGVLKAVQENDSLKNVPVIVITGTSDVERQVQALDAGAFDVMLKPINAKVALHRVRSIISRWEARTAAEQNTLLAKQLHESEIDAKTGIYTQQAFCRNVELLLKKNPADKFVLIRFDIDNFKLYNDAFGVAAGDKLLEYLGKFCRAHALPGAIFGHYEADHFVCCIKRELFCEERLTALLSQIESSQRDKFELTGRIGVYNIEDTSLPVALMCDRALLALHAVKGDYSKQISYYDDAMRLSLIEEQQIVSEMASALEDGQFIVYIQPQYNQSDLSLYGGEALVRWQHPVKGLISPGKFIPIFERNGFISQLGRYMIDKVCAQQRAWLDAGYTVVPISVNMSRRDVYNAGLCDYIISTINKYNLTPNLIHLEITETAYMENPHQMIDVVGKLREAGFSIEMDDFGSGYSSLNTLKDVPVDVLKLDMQFMSDGMESPRSGNILSSVIRMAHWLKLPVIAEGVETKKQADFLKSIGCLYIQGYYFDKPMPIPEFEQRLRTKMPDIMRDHRFTEDIKGATDFLSASTQSALLFNSFVGGAGIIEYDGETVEGLRFNDKFFEALGVSQNEYHSKQLKLQERFDEKNWKIYVDTIKQAIDTCDESVCELQSKPLGTRSEPIWTRTRMRYLAQNGNRYVLYISVDNIDRHMRTLQKNTELSERLSAVMDSVPGGILNFEVHERMQITYANETLATMFGYTHAEYMHLFADNPYSMFHPDESEKMTNKAISVFKSDCQYVNEEYRHICKDGSYKWIRLNSRIFRRDDNTCYGSGIITDVDEEVKTRLRAQEQAEQLKRNHMSLKALYDTIPCGIIELSVKNGCFKLVDFNDTAWRIFGYKTREDYIAAQRGNDMLMHVHPDELDTVRSFLRAAFSGRGQQLSGYEHRIVRVDGAVSCLRLYMQKTSYAEHESTLQCVFVDVTAENQSHSVDSRNARAENTSHEQPETLPVSANFANGYVFDTINNERELYRRVFEQADIAGVEVNYAKGSINYTQTYKKYAISLLNQTEVFNGHVDASAVHPDDTAKLNEFFNAVALGQNYTETVLRLKMTNGSYRFTRTAGMLIRDKDGDRQDVIITLIDINEETIVKESLHRVSERMVNIIANIPSGIGIYEFRDNDIYPIYVSDQACAVFGFSREEYDLLIANGEPIIHMHKEAVFTNDTMPRLLAGETVNMPRIHARRKDGGMFWLSVSAHAVRRENGTAVVYAVLSDVTATVQNEKIIESQNNELSAVIASVPGGIFKYSADSDEFTYVSDTMLSMLGYTKQEFERKFHNKFSEMVWHEDRATALNKINSDIAANGETDSCEYRIETKSGYLKWVYDVGHLITDADGKQWYIVVIIDNDEKKRYETRLAELNSQASALIKNTPGGVTRYRINRNRVSLDYVSDGFLSMLGYDRAELEQLLSSNVNALVHPSERAFAVSQTESIIQSGSSGSCQYRLKKRNGDYLWVMVISNYVGESGVGYLYSSYMDISVIKKMQEQLSGDKHQVETLIRNIPGGLAVFQLTKDGVKRKYLSESAKRILGCKDSNTSISNAEILLDNVYPDDMEPLNAAIQKAASNKESFHYEYRRTDDEGHLRWIDLAANPITDDDGMVCFYGIYTDITARKLTQERVSALKTAQLERYEHEMKSLSVTKGESLISKLYLDLTAGNLISSWVDKNECKPYDDLDISAIKERIIMTALYDSDRQLISEKLNLDAALKSLSNKDNIAECSIEYRRLNAAGRISWAQTTARAFYDAETGHIMAFVFTYDIDETKMPTLLVERLMKKDAELLGLIYLATGIMHTYLCTDADDLIRPGADIDYASGCKEFVTRHIDAPNRESAISALSIETIKRGLDNSHASYRCAYWLEINGKREHKGWVFSYLDESHTSIIVMRTDTARA